MILRGVGGGSESQASYSKHNDLVRAWTYTSGAQVVHKVDKTIHWISRYPVDSAVCFISPYPLDPLNSIICSYNNLAQNKKHQSTYSTK